jgi:hypothetical protein
MNISHARVYRAICKFGKQLIFQSPLQAHKCRIIAKNITPTCRLPAVNISTQNSIRSDKSGILSRSSNQQSDCGLKWAVQSTCNFPVPPSNRFPRAAQATACKAKPESHNTNTRCESACQPTIRSTWWRPWLMTDSLCGGARLMWVMCVK